ncbi:MAG: bactofilin family protein [Anaerolineaceae bacterium]
MIKKLSKKKIAGIMLVVCLIALLPAGAVHAADFSHDGIVEAGDVIEDDVFLSSEQCEMNGTINGNLVATCQHITMNGTVTGDAFLFAETITVCDAAKVDGNLFAFGADVKIAGNVSGSAVSAGESVLLDDTAVVGRNLYFAGYQGKIEEGAAIGMDVYGGANQIIMNGTVARDLTAGVNAFELRGSIGRDASIQLGTGNENIDTSVYSAGMNYYPESIPSGLRFYEGASVGNNLTYEATENMDAQLQDYVQGKIVFNQITAADNNLGRTGTYTGNAWLSDDFSHFRVASSFSRMISYFALGALAFWLAKKQVVRVRENGIAFPGKAFGWGFIVILVGMMSLILVPGTFILLGILLGVISLGGLLFTWYGVVGLIIALVFALFFLVVFTLSKVVAAYVFGSWLMQDVFKTKTQNRWIDLLIGVLFYVILRAIPFVGWAVGLAASLYGTGTLLIAFSRIEKKKETKVVKTK